jgi:hypothetical protein
MKERVGLATVANFRYEQGKEEATPATDKGLALENQLARLRLDQVFHQWISDMYAINDLLECDLILVGVFIRNMAFKTEGGILPVKQKELVEDILKSGKKTFVISFGNPYPMRELSGLRGYAYTFGEGQICLKIAEELLTGNT